jgi:hypothetical protein
MDIENKEEVLTGESITPPLPEDEKSSESYTKEELLAGTPRVPLKDTFQFLLQYVANEYEKKIGLNNSMDRNFFFFQELASRNRLENIKRYTFLHPMVVDPEQRNALMTIQPYPEVINAQNEKIDRKCFLVHMLVPSEENSESGVIALNTFFQQEIRDREMERGGLKLAHILASILNCVDTKFPHFVIQKGKDEEEDSDKRSYWSFQCLPKGDEVHFYIYHVRYEPPHENIHEATLSPWISHTIPTFQREHKATKHFRFTPEDITSFRNDQDVIDILKQPDEEEKSSK